MNEVCIVTMQYPCLVGLLLWTFPLNLFLKLPQNHSRNVHSSSVLCNKFFVDNAFDVKKADQHWFYPAQNLAHFLQSQWNWWLPLRWLLFCFWVKAINPCFTTSNDLSNEIWVIFTMLFAFPAHMTVLFYRLLADGVQYSAFNVLPVKFAGKSSTIDLKFYKHCESFADDINESFTNLEICIVNASWRALRMWVIFNRCSTTFETFTWAWLKAS